MQTRKIEVDQSVRVEELTRDTILGIANERVSFTIVIPRRAKRVLHEKFRRQGKPKKFAPYVFAAAISEALQRAPFQSSDVVIDIEYPGYEQEILEIVKRRHPEIEVYFTSIGKKSPAHFAAYGVHTGRKSADQIISITKLLKLMEEIKNGPRAVTRRDKPDDSQPI